MIFDFVCFSKKKNPQWFILNWSTLIHTIKETYTKQANNKYEKKEKLIIMLKRWTQNRQGGWMYCILTEKKILLKSDIYYEYTSKQQISPHNHKKMYFNIDIIMFIFL